MVNQKEKTINLKLDSETKSKFETLAFVKRCTLQDLCTELVKNAISENADIIAEVESKRDKL